MTSLRARLQRYRAPVEYGSVRPWLQRVRAVAAASVLAGVAVIAILDISTPAPTVVATAAVLVHALTRGRRRAPFVESVTVDALALGIGLGGIAHAHVALVAATAYLIAACLTFGTPTTMFGGLLVFAAATGAGGASFESLAGVGTTTHPIVWFATAALLAGVALPLISASSAVAIARHLQEEALDLERRASEMKNEFVSMVTHELRTPLTNIAGFAMTMQDAWQDLDPTEIEEFLRIIVSEADHLGHLVEDVLTIPRLEAGRLLLDLTDFALQPAAYRIADLLFPAGGDRSAAVAVGGSVRVHADPNRVEQVLRNLLENARKYGGDQVTIDATRRGDTWMIVVADNGPGVPTGHQDRIFGVFEQVSGGDARSDTGFGLGLAVCRNLVEAMGGRIWYEPGFPVGARFCFTLPAADAAAAAFEAVA